LNDYLQRSAADIASAMRSRQLPEFQDRGQRVLTLFSAAAPDIVSSVERAARTQLRLQPCIRDIRPEHVLFSGDEVSGIVDFGAMRDDHVAADIARLLGGMVGDDPSGWRTGLLSYETIRPLDERERSLVRVFDRTTVLLSGMNWLRWLYVEPRRFDNPERILRRLDTLIERLTRLCYPDS
jgi:homoserine kinase type II